MIYELIRDNLVWLPEKGIGYYPVNSFPYNKKYFEHYSEIADTKMGKQITKARIDFVDRYCKNGIIIDVGIGCGDFIMRRYNTFGYDVNPIAVKWLKEKALFTNLYKDDRPDALTFWDSLEHIEVPKNALSRARNFVFLSMPIFRDLPHLLRSKHFKKQEHFWYFTEKGLLNFMYDCGFELIDKNNFETLIGREDIMSYAFRRIYD